MTSRRWPLLVVLAAAAALGQTPQHRLFLQPNLPQGASYAFLEFAPANGAGMGTACACSSVTGAKGETLTFARTSSATCTKTAAGGLATSGIADGDLVSCASDQPRVEYDSGGVLGLMLEASAQNVLLRSNEPANAAWADVGTPGLTTGQTDPFGTTNGVAIDDNDGAAYEGRSQAVTVSAATPYIMSCYLKAGTATTATLSLDGTTAAVTGLSATTWTLAKVTDASSSGVSISARVLVGNATTVTGAIIYGGCQVEIGSYSTTYAPTGAAVVTRATESAGVVVAGFDGSGAGCMFATIDYSDGHRWFNITADTATLNLTSAIGTTGRLAYQFNFTTFSAYGGSSVASQAVNYTGLNRVGLYWTGTSVTSVFNGATASGTWTAPTSAQTSLQFGTYVGGGRTINTIISRVQLDSSPTRCRR